MKSSTQQMFFSVIANSGLAIATCGTIYIGLVKTTNPAQAVSFYTNISDLCARRFLNPDGSISYNPFSKNRSAFANFDSYLDQAPKYGPTAITSVPESSYNLGILA